MKSVEDMQSSDQMKVKGINEVFNLSIKGKGFFTVRGANNQEHLYTRHGKFQLNEDGNIITFYGLNLVGFLADENGNITAAMGDLVVDCSSLVPKSTTSVNIELNLNAAAVRPANAFLNGFAANNLPAENTYNNSTSLQVYDSLGNPHMLDMYFVKLAAERAWQVHVGVDGRNVANGGFTIAFYEDGNYVDGHGDITIQFNPNEAEPCNIDINLKNCTQLAAPFSLTKGSQDGYPRGNFSSFKIDQKGIICANYGNGQSKVFGQVALANVFDADQPELDPYVRCLELKFNYAYQLNQGLFVYGAPGAGDLGTIDYGWLEMIASSSVIFNGHNNFDVNLEFDEFDEVKEEELEKQKPPKSPRNL